MVTIERPTKGIDIAKFDELLKPLLSGTATIATFTNDKLHGTFPEEFMNYMKKKSNIKLVDASGFFERVIAIKTQPEQVRKLFTIGNNAEIRESSQLYLCSDNIIDRKFC